MKRAFTLVEIIFVLVVLGIIAALGSEIIVKIYENYFLTRTTAAASYKLDVAALKISKLLSYRVKGSEVARNIYTNTLVTMATQGSAFRHIEWVAKAYEARRGMWDGTSYLQPGWSGLADLLASNKFRLETPGSKLSVAKNIISKVYGIDIATQDQCGVVFYETYETDPIRAFGWDGSRPNAIYSVTMLNDTRLWFSDPNAKTISDIYDLACTAYAIRWENGRLNLYYDYRPWKGENYRRHGRVQTIVEDVTAFMVRKRDVDGAIQFRICVKDASAGGTEVEFCTRKVVF